MISRCSLPLTKLSIRSFSSLKNHSISLLSIPLNLGQPLRGPDRAPRLLYDNGLLHLLSDCGWEVNPINEDFSQYLLPESELPQTQFNCKNCFEVGTVSQKVMTTTKVEAEKGNFVLILGGDHCIPIGTIPGLKSSRPSMGVVWVDAHADLNTPSSSLSGNMHGMPLAFLLGLVPNHKILSRLTSFSSWFPRGEYERLERIEEITSEVNRTLKHHPIHFDSSPPPSIPSSSSSSNSPSPSPLCPMRGPVLSPSELVYIGLRDLDMAEKRFIKEMGIKAFTMQDIDRYGIGKVMEMTLSHLHHHNCSDIHLSFDIDALDPFYAPATGTAVRGGLTFREGNFICEALSESGSLSSMELVEVNPSLYSDKEASLTLDMGLKLIGSALGQRIL